MKSTGIRLVAEYYDESTGKAISATTLHNASIQHPDTIKDLGYLHEEQIKILQAIQEVKLHYETQLINQNNECPICGAKTKANGQRKSKFHAVLTDHEVKIQRRHCQCGWNSQDTVEKLYGLSSHPDLLEKQILQGAENSYRQASRQLNAESKQERSINNDDRIRRNVALAGAVIEEAHLNNRRAVNQAEAVPQLVVVVDGGHLKHQMKERQSFEAMIASVFCPDNVRRIDKHHRQITQKTSVASARSDHQETIKALLHYACRQEGANARVTQITCLTDGASNCWSIANSLKHRCKKLTRVLDWFHVTKRFTIINRHVDPALKEDLDKVKWCLWHGQANNALQRLHGMMTTVFDNKLLAELQTLYDYLNRNKSYLVHYQAYDAQGLPFTSTYAESSVNAVINQRQKNNKQMQWSREGAHHVLQIRTSQFSQTWQHDWEKVQQCLYKKAA